MKGILKFVTNEKFYLPVIYILIGFVLYMILNKLLSRMTNRKTLSGKDKRVDTIISLVKSILRYLVIIFIVLSILNVYGVNTSSIIASLGIFAAVIGLAFQDILKDLLAGITIIFDNKYAVGDVVKINDFTGTVISLGLRTTKVKAYTGEIKCISNSSFTEVINYSLSNTELFLKLGVSYNTDIDKLEEVLEGVKDDILKVENVKDVTFLGVDELSESAIIYIIQISCKSMTAIGVKRKVLKLIKQEFDKKGISIPYNTVDVNIRK